MMAATNTDALTEELTGRIERLLAAKIAAVTPVVGGGYTPARRLLCQTDRHRFFVKVGATPLTCGFLRREIFVYTRIAGIADFVPQLVACEEHEAEPLLILEDLSPHRWPPPWEPRSVEQVLEQIHRMHAITIVPLETYEQTHGERGSNWQEVADKPEQFLVLGIADSVWLEKALPVLIAGEAECVLEGESLTHWDLRSDNICLTETRPLFIDWNHACLSDPKVDLGFWLPSLAYEGGPLPEEILPNAPEVAARVSGFFAVRAGKPFIPDAPGVRQVQWRQLQTALPWACRALDLPLP